MSVTGSLTTADSSPAAIDAAAIAGCRSAASSRNRCTVPWLLAAASSRGSTPGGLNARQWTVAAVEPRRKLNMRLAPGWIAWTRTTVPVLEAVASRLPSWLHAMAARGALWALISTSALPPSAARSYTCVRRCESMCVEGGARM
jgi:hypothetical protein